MSTTPNTSKTSDRGLGLVVPISLEALCIGNKNATLGPEFVGATADFSMMPYFSNSNYDLIVNQGPNLSERVLSQPFTGKQPMSEGIHLHWALPDALTHGIQDATTGEITYPAVPDRWLIVRTIIKNATTKTPSAALKAWVIESNYIAETNPHQDPSGNDIFPPTITIPFPPTQPGLQAFQYLGKVYDYATWQEGQGTAYVEKLTAIGYENQGQGYGEPTFAAFYPNCASVFGFYDSATSLADFVPLEDTLMYQVIGWFSQTASDPLANGSAVDSQWHYPASIGNIPAYSLYHGIVRNVGWDANRDYFSGTNQETSPEVAIGANAAEALSALFAHQLASDNLPHLETILNALQVGALADLDKPSGVAQANQALHKSTFGRESGGTIWLVAKTDADTGSDPVEATLPDEIAEALNQLNLSQAQSDALGEQILSARKQIFADWYKYMLGEYSTDSNIPAHESDKINDIISLIKQEAEAIDPKGENDNLAHQQTTLRAKIATQHKALEAKLPTGFQLQPVAAPRYWQAKDPLVLLSGPAAQPAVRYGGDGRLSEDGTLACRLTRQLLTGLSVAANVAGNTDVLTLNTPSLPQLGNNAAVAHLDAAKALISESFLLDPNAAHLIAATLQKDTPDGSAINFGTLARGIQGAQNDLFDRSTAANRDATFIGTVPSAITVTNWLTPWLPIALQWQVDYLPVQEITDSTTNYTTDFLTANYKLDAAQTDLTYTGVAPASNVQQYSGSVILTPNATVDSNAQIDNYLKYNQDPELETIQTDIANIPILSQGLSGFNAAMLMFEQTLQLQVNDPIASTPEWLNFSNTTVRNAVGDMNEAAPQPENNYNPIRAGYLKLSRLVLVDAFGRTLDIDLSQPIIAQNLLPVTNLKNEDYAALAPRLVQPSRLLFRWISAKNDRQETNSHPASSPIFGWVIPNHLDNSLAIYGATGAAIGSLMIDGSGDQILWQGAPGNNTTYNQPIETAFADANPHLQDFALTIHQNGTAFLEAMLKAIDRAKTLISPQNYKQDASTAVLIDRPLALVRISLQLDLQGLPAYNQSWDAFNAIVESPNSANPVQRSTNQFEKVQFPVQLGDLTNINDGLIGYFLTAEDKTDYAHFYAPAADDSNPGVTPPTETTLLLESDPAAGPTYASMLVDPRAKIHATTGILPVKSIEIPPDQYMAALKTMTLTFLTAPVLSSANKFSLPIPKEGGKQWSWIQQDSTGWTVETSIGRVNEQATMDYTPQQLSEGWLQLSDIVD
ncbi:MAG: hypothetical protein AAGG51_21035 [Cyanobacteria bacterium P01_G01_bin.54]